MAVFQSKIKNYSKLLPEEIHDLSKTLFENMNPEEQELSIQLLNSLLEGDVHTVFNYETIDYDKPPIPVRDWLDDPYYAGEIGKSLYGVWKDDLVELFEGKVYNTAILTGGLGCLREDSLIWTKDGKKRIGDINRFQEYRSFDTQSQKFVYQQGTAAFPKGKDYLYRVVTERGESFASAHHRFFCADGMYRSVEELLGLVGASPLPVKIAFSSHQDSSLEFETLEILAIEKQPRKDWYWDIQVSDTNNYVHDCGFISHNSGKSTFAQVAILRMLYEASCLKNPVQSYGLAEGSKISFCFLAPTADVARRVVFEGLVEKFRRIPYFMNDFPPLNKLKKEVIKSNELPFPKSILLVSGSSSDNSIIGQNVVGGFVDELNFFQKMSQTKQKTGKIHDRFGLDDKAGRLFDAIMRRMKSRFLNQGRLPGILIGASSKTSEDSLTERLIRQAAESRDPTIFVRDRSIIDVKPHQFSKQKFKVFIGDDTSRPKILSSDEESDYNSELIVEVPEDLRREFEANIEESLRDLAGIATNAISVFISDSEKINACIDKDRKHPFKCFVMADTGQWDSRSPYHIDWQSIAKQMTDGSWEPVLNPNRPRHIHLDPGLTGDAYAMAITHIAGTRRIERPSDSSDPIVEEEPIYVVDFVLRVQGNIGSEVIFKNIRKIIYDFSEHGYSIAKITMDTFQSRETQQILKEQGYNVETLSLDRSKDPYKYLRRVIYDGRLNFYKYNPLITELMRLEDNLEKVDHGVGGSKDTSDAVCGSIWSLFESGNYGHAIVEKSISVEPDNSANEFKIDPAQEIQTSGQEQIPIKRPKTINPSYKKHNADGSVTDLSRSNLPIIEMF